MHHYTFISVKSDLKIFIVYDVQMNVKNNFFLKFYLSILFNKNMLNLLS